MRQAGFGVRIGSDSEPTWRRLGAVSGPSWGHLGAIRGDQGPSCAPQEPSWGHQGPSCGKAMFAIRITMALLENIMWLIKTVSPIRRVGKHGKILHFRCGVLENTRKHGISKSACWKTRENMVSPTHGVTRYPLPAGGRATRASLRQGFGFADAKRKIACNIKRLGLWDAGARARLLLALLF